MATERQCAPVTVGRATGLAEASSHRRKPEQRGEFGLRIAGLPSKRQCLVVVPRRFDVFAERRLGVCEAAQHLQLAVAVARLAQQHERPPVVLHRIRQLAEGAVYKAQAGARPDAGSPGLRRLVVEFAGHPHCLQIVFDGLRAFACGSGLVAQCEQRGEFAAAVVLLAANTPMRAA